MSKVNKDPKTMLRRVHQYKEIPEHIADIKTKAILRIIKDALGQKRPDEDLIIKKI